MKISNYTITTNILHKNAGVTLVFSAKSGILKAINSECWNGIVGKSFSSLEKDNYIYLHDKDKPLDNNQYLSVFSKEDYASFVTDEIIVPNDVDEFSQVINENKQHIKNSKKLYYVIQPTANCSLGCQYCGQKHSDTLLSQEKQQAILDRISKKIDFEADHQLYDELNIKWFGGEPLLGLSVIKLLSPQLQDLAKKKKLKYSSSMVTNGVQLNLSMIDILTQYGIKDFEVTLDGTAEFHDCRRCTKNGSATFDLIYKNISDILKYTNQKIDISIRCNVDNTNRNAVIPLLEKFKKDELHEKISFYIAPIHSWGNDAHLSAIDNDEFAKFEIECLIGMKNLGFQCVSYLPNRIKQVCMAVDDLSECIDPYGNIFHCTEVSLVPNYIIEGKNIYQKDHILDAKSLNDKKNNLRGFYDLNVIKKHPCFSCEIFPVCGGGCPKQWNEGLAPCSSLKFNIKQRMVLQYIASKSEYN